MNKIQYRFSVIFLIGILDQFWGKAFSNCSLVLDMETYLIYEFHFQHYHVWNVLKYYFCCGCQLGPQDKWGREQVKDGIFSKDCFTVYVNSIFTDTGFLSFYFQTNKQWLWEGAIWKQTPLGIINQYFIYTSETLHENISKGNANILIFNFEILKVIKEQWQ